ncbi:Band 7-like protein, partial [Daphnia magna]
RRFNLPHSLGRADPADRQARAQRRDGAAGSAVDGPAPSQVDAFARFRITRPDQMYRTIRTEDRLREQLRTILGSSLRNELGKRTFATLLSAERGEVMENIQTALNREASKYGAEVIDVRIKRADLPAATLQSAYNRMRSARNQEAIAIDAEGQKEAQIIRAEAEAE